jgi:tetratricopeptide (TPR) repeat protein
MIRLRRRPGRSSSPSSDHDISALVEAVRLRPDLVGGHLELGRALVADGRIEAARQAFARAIRLDDRCAEAHEALGALPERPPSRADFAVGDVLRSSGGPSRHGYTVLDVRRGGFGVVYVARLEDMDELVVLKTFQARYLWSDTDRERFAREALTWVGLEPHPHVVSARWLEWIEGFPVLALDFVEGGDLARRLADGPLEPELALDLALQFCDGLAFAHERLGIIHRDVKPANLLLADSDWLKVTDFGLARAFGVATEAALGLAGLAPTVTSLYSSPLGTERYMAPEQFDARSTLDTRTDVYAAGIVLYEILGGEPPVSGSVAKDHVLAATDHVELPAEGIVLPIVLHCVEPDPAARPRDLAALRAELASAYTKLTGRPAPAPATALRMGAPEWDDKGRALANLGRLEEAIVCYDRALGLEPGDPGTLNNRAKALGELGRYDEALKCWERALAAAPTLAILWGNKALLLATLERYDEALDCYEHALALEPKDHMVWLGRGIALAALERHLEALASFEHGLELTDRDFKLWRNRGAALAELGRPKEAIASFDRALAIAPRDREGWRMKGEVLIALARFEEALTCFDRGLEIEADDASLLVGKGKALLAAGRPAEGLTFFDRVVDRGPRDEAFWQNRGAAFVALGRWKDALAAFSAGLDLVPESSLLWGSKGDALAHLERLEPAVAAYDRAIELAPGYRGAWQNRGLVLHTLRRYEQALASFERGLRIEPRHAALWHNKARALAALGREREAAVAAHKAHAYGFRGRE